MFLLFLDLGIILFCVVEAIMNFNDGTTFIIFMILTLNSIYNLRRNFIDKFISKRAG
jgi:hypothetical protein